jgi:hypothetical protein
VTCEEALLQLFAHAIVRVVNVDNMIVFVCVAVMDNNNTVIAKE